MIIRWADLYREYRKKVYLGELPSIIVGKILLKA